MAQTLYDQYALLDAEIASLEAKKEELRVLILKEMVDKGQKTVDIGTGKFSVSRLKKWTYTQKVTELDEALKARKALEQSTEEASYTETESLRFTKVTL